MTKVKTTQIQKDPFHKKKKKKEKKKNAFQATINQ